MVRVGLISDTHGLLRPQALTALRGSDVIVHGGDIGDAQILAQLATVAPVTAVRGNNDRGGWADAVPETALLEAGGLRIHVLHDLHELAIDPAESRIRVVVSGHSHQPRVEERQGVVYVNPGSAGPRRFKLPIAVARLYVSEDGLRPELVELTI